MRRRRMASFSNGRATLVAGLLALLLASVFSAGATTPVSRATLDDGNAISSTASTLEWGPREVTMYIEQNEFPPDSVFVDHLAKTMDEVRYVGAEIVETGENPIR